MKTLDISRRNFLRGLGGATVGLPFLEAGAPRRAAAATAPKRFVLFFQCAGVKREMFYPSKMGPITAADFMGKSTEPLAPYASKVLIPRGINNSPDGSDGHAQRPATCTTCSPSGGFPSGISIDQEIAKHVNPKGRPAMGLHVGAFEKSQRGCVSFFPGRPAFGQANPALAYRDLMGLTPPATGGGADQAQALERLTKRRQSVLDLVQGRMEELKRLPLAKADRDRLDLHFTSIREIEAKTMGGPGADATVVQACGLPDPKQAELKGLQSVESDGMIPKVSYLHLEVLALAMACDYTRAATIMYGTVGTGSTWRFEGVICDRMQHAVSHRDGPDPETKLAQIDNWHAKHMRFFLDKLSAYAEPGGTVLDNSAVVWTNEIDHGVGHNITNMPYVIVGSLGGYLKTGEHVKLEGGPKNAKLWVTMLQGFGIQAQSFGVAGGQASGALSELVRS